MFCMCIFLVVVSMDLINVLHVCRTCWQRSHASERITYFSYLFFLHSAVFLNAISNKIPRFPPHTAPSSFCTREQLI